MPPPIRGGGIIKRCAEPDGDAQISYKWVTVVPNFNAMPQWFVTVLNFAELCVKWRMSVYRGREICFRHPCVWVGMVDP